jgi:tRNA (cmo5U34)-methyltransferase
LSTARDPFFAHAERTRSTMSHSVGNHLRIQVSEYDREIGRFIPGYEEMLDRGSDLVSAIAPALVLDLGAGTGAFSERVLSRTETTVELWDIDPAMLEVARVRLDRFGDRARTLRRSFDDTFPACHAIIASLALHHIPRLERKTALYARAFDALEPGGLLVNADAAMPRAGPDRDRTFRQWADHMVAHGIDERSTWRHFEEWAEEDTYFSTEEEIEAMASVGFDARCDWSLGPMTLIVGVR